MSCCFGPFVAVGDQSIHLPGHLRILSYLQDGEHYVKTVDSRGGIHAQSAVSIDLECQRELKERPQQCHRHTVLYIAGYMI
jgi:hypothetical protein